MIPTFFKKKVKEFEGFRLKPYLCPGGFETIGYGHRIRFEEKFFEIDYDEADVLLERDIMDAATQMRSAIQVPLTEGQSLALTDFVFNLGIGKARSSTLFRLVNQQRWSQAAAEFDKWVHAAGHVLDGLIRRRAWERELFEGKK